MTIPASLADAFARLTSDAQHAVGRDYEARVKSLAFAYMAWFLFGWHYIYLRRTGMQIAFWLTFGGLAMWWVVDAFRLPGLVQRLNEDTARELMVQHRALS
jgi:hypothetical protein